MLLTVGHGTASEVEFGGRLRAAGVEAVVDVRTAPGSRRNPHLGREQLAAWLPSYDVAYRWERRLGGFRRLPPDSPDVALRNESFRAYAGWMRTPEFRAALAALLTAAGEERIAAMCSESVWWRCHRRLIADAAVLLHDVEVRHLMPDGRLTPHRPTDAVRVAGDELIYDVGGGE